MSYKATKLSQSHNNNAFSPFTEVAPQWLRGEWGRKTIDTQDFPETLHLRLAELSDTKKIVEFFNSARKRQADPNNFVKPRPENDMGILTRKERIAVIEDQNDEIIAICFAFTHKVRNMPDHHLDSRVTEIGTVLSCAKGLRLTEIAISMLALNIQKQEGEDHRVIAKVATNNSPANKLFKKNLKWDQIKRESHIVPLFNSSAGNTMRGNSINSRNWYNFGVSAQYNAKDMLHNLYGDGYLSKRGVKIPFTIDSNIDPVIIGNEITAQLDDFET